MDSAQAAIVKRLLELADGFAFEADLGADTDPRATEYRDLRRQLAQIDNVEDK